MNNETEASFSSRLEAWLSNKRPKTIAELNKVFGEKSFAVLLVLLMSIPALPVPTGGITHIFEAIAMLLALELMLGRRTIWWPKIWKDMKIRPVVLKKVLPKLVKLIRWFERFTKPRLRNLLQNRIFLMAVGIVILGFCLVAFLAPPFSGLDTLPALGVLLIGIALILDDGLILLFGLLAGSVGSALVVLGGGLVVHFIKQLF